MGCGPTAKMFSQPLAPTRPHAFGEGLAGGGRWQLVAVHSQLVANLSTTSAN